MKLLFIGPPGAGKGTQAALVAERLGIPHISTGEMFRHHVANGTELGSEVKAIMEEGGYVPDDITVAMLGRAAGRARRRAGFILDGFPADGPQVDALDRLLGLDGLDRVVLFEVDEDALVDRMMSSRKGRRHRGNDPQPIQDLPGADRSPDRELPRTGTGRHSRRTSARSKR